MFQHERRRPVCPRPAASSSKIRKVVSKMIKAFINGSEVTIYEFKSNEARCYVPEYDLMNWYRLDQIEVRTCSE